MAITVIKKGTAAVESNKALTGMIQSQWMKHPDLPGYLSGLDIPVQGGSAAVAEELRFLRDLARIRKQL